MIKAFTITQFLKIYFVLMLAGSSNSFCQTARIDSIKNILKAGRQSDKEKLATTLALCGQYSSLHPDSLIAYVKTVKALTGNSKNFADAAMVNYYEVICKSKKGKVDTALMMVEKNLADKEVLALPVIANKFRLIKTGIFVRQNKLKEALENALAYLHVAEKNNDAEDQLKAEIQIGWVYMELNQYNDAIKWFFAALSTNKRRNVPEPSVLVSNIAAVYNSLKKNDSAILFIKRAITLSEQEQDLSYLCNSCYIYSDICIDLGDIKKAEELLKQGVEIRRKIGDPYYITADLAQLGKFYATTSQYTKGVETIKEGIAIANENRITSKLLFLYSTLAENYKAANDLSNYSNTLNTIIALKDSLYNQNSAQAVTELQAKYELQKKENTIIQQHLDLVEKNYWMYGALSLLIFGGILGFVYYKSNQRKQKQKMALALMEEKRLSEKAILLAEEKERKRIAADLHDNLGAYAAAISSNVDHISAIQKTEQEHMAFEELKANSQAIVSQLNDTIWILTKEVLALTAISDRLKVFIQRLHNSYPAVQIDVKENMETDHLLAPMQALHLFKILQEAIINALRHSSCSLISIYIESNDHWKITIADNGEGIAENPVSATGGNGLHNMKNRSKDAGWNISWQANTPTGTAVKIESTTN